MRTYYDPIVFRRRGRPPKPRDEAARDNRVLKNTTIDLHKTAPKPAWTLAQAARDDTYVRRFISRHFPHLKSDLAKITRNSLRGLKPQPTPEHPTVLHMLVGTAIDYRIRYYFSNEAHRSAVIKKGLSHLRSPVITYNSIACKNGSQNLWETSKGQLGKALISSLENFLSEAKPKRRRLKHNLEVYLCQYCCLLAQLDWMYRSPLFSASTERLIEIADSDVAKMLRKAADRDVIKDIVSLSKIFFEKNRKLILSHRHAAIGKSLSGNRYLRSDFDLVVDGTLFEIKTTKNPEKHILNSLRQALGYWLLDFRDKFKIRRMAIYFPRQGHLQIFDIESDILSGRKSRKIRIEFRKEAKLNHALSP